MMDIKSCVGGAAWQMLPLCLSRLSWEIVVLCRTCAAKPAKAADARTVPPYLIIVESTEIHAGRMLLVVVFATECHGIHHVRL